jgi:hypothetical protein
MLPEYAACLHNYGYKLHVRYRCSCWLSDLKETICASTNSVLLTCAEDPLLAGRLNYLGIQFECR